MVADFAALSILLIQPLLQSSQVFEACALFHVLGELRVETPALSFLA